MRGGAAPLALLAALLGLPPGAETRLKLSSRLGANPTAARAAGRPPPPRPAESPLAATRRAQAIDCEAQMQAVDEACLADVCSAECAIRVYEAQTPAVFSACTGIDVAYDLSGAGVFPASYVNPTTGQVGWELAWQRFNTGIGVMAAVKNLAACIPPCEAEPCANAAVCTDVAEPVVGFTGYTCDCTTGDALGYTGADCDIACLHGVVGDTAADECTPCGDGEEPVQAYTACAPCRAGTAGTEGVCTPCPPGKQPAPRSSCIDICLTHTTEILCEQGYNAGAGCVWDADAASCARDPALEEWCPLADMTVGTPAEQETVCETQTPISGPYGHCHYVAELASCEACPDANPGSGLASYSTVGICEPCPLGSRPNAARSACVSLAEIYANPPEGAIPPETIVTYSSSATLDGDFSSLIVAPALQGVAEISDATTSSATIIGAMRQSAVFALNFESTSDSDGPMQRKHLDTPNGAAMLASTLAYTLGVPPAGVSVGEIDLDGDVFIAPATGVVPDALDPSPAVATVIIAGDIASTGVEGSAARSAFVREVVLGIAVTSGVEPSRINVVRIQAASIEVLIEISDSDSDPNGKSAAAAMTSLLQAAANGDMMVGDYSVLGAAEISYGAHACSVLPGMETCASGSCVTDTSHCEEGGDSGRRQLQAATIPVIVNFVVNTTGFDFVALLDDPTLGDTFAQVMADGSGMNLEEIFSGSCVSIAGRDWSLAGEGRVDVTCTDSTINPVCPKFSDCIYNKFAGDKFADGFTYLTWETDSDVSTFVSDSQPYDVHLAYPDEATDTATALEKCMQLCLDHPDCTAFTHQPCDTAPCSTTPTGMRGCRFGYGAPVICATEVVPLADTCPRPDGWCSTVATEGCTSTLVASPNTVTEEDATLCVLTSGSPGSCAPDPTANAGSSVATCAYVPAAENVYTRGDCDGDGFADHLCVDAVTNERGTLLSGSGCTDNWPSAAASECAALPAAGYATLAHLASDEGSALGAAQAGTVADCTFLCDADSSCESFNYNTVDSECTLMDKATTASDDVVDDATAAGHVTYYKQPLCVAAVATVPNVDLEATKIAETGVDAAGTTIDISLYLEHNAWTPDITLARKYFTVANVGLANEPVTNTVMPYEVRAVMAGEDPAGVAAAKRVYGNMTLLAAVLDAAGAVVYDGSGVAQQIMQLTDVAAVSTATKGACPPGQWARDPWCYACTVCGPGFAKISDCGEFVDTVCEPCPHETYSNHGIECLPCTDPCLGGVQFEATKCTASTNRVCGTCAPGSVGVRLCDHKSLTRAQPNTISPGSPFYQPEFAEQGKFECPWTCIGNNKPKLSRNSQKMSANWASDHLIPTSNASPNYVPRTRIGGVEAWVCKGREAQGQMMYGVRSAGRVCAPQKSVSVNQQTFASVATVDASLANDGNQVRTCVCVESSPVAWWGTQLKRAAVDPTLYIYASGDCCANSVPDEAAEPMTVYIGTSSDFSAATQCGSFDPAGRAGYVVGNIECSGSGSYIFVSAPNKLSLVEVKVYTLKDLDVGIGHPREFVPRSERDAQTRVRTAAEVAAGREGAVLESDGGAWIDRSPNGISTRIGNFALGITPHRPFYSRFGDEFQQTGEQHVTQDSYLVGDEYYDGTFQPGDPGQQLSNDGVAVPFNNRRVYVGTHLTSGDGSLLLEPVTGGLTSLRDGIGTEAEGTGGEGGGRTSRVWTVGSEDSTHGSQQEFGPTGMTLGNVEILDDYVQNNPLSAPGEQCVLRHDLPAYSFPCAGDPRYIPGTIEEPSTTCPCDHKSCGDGASDFDPNGDLCRLNDEGTGCHVTGGGCVFVPCECTFTPATPQSDRPMTAAQAYRASQGQRIDSPYHTRELPWLYVEQWGWARDETWFARNVRRSDLTDAADPSLIGTYGRRRTADEEGAEPAEEESVPIEFEAVEQSAPDRPQDLGSR